MVFQMVIFNVSCHVLIFFSESLHQHLTTRRLPICKDLFVFNNTQIAVVSKIQFSYKIVIGRFLLCCFGTFMSAIFGTFLRIFSQGFSMSFLYFFQFGLPFSWDLSWSLCCFEGGHGKKGWRSCVQMMRRRMPSLFLLGKKHRIHRLAFVQLVVFSLPVWSTSKL